MCDPEHRDAIEADGESLGLGPDGGMAFPLGMLLEEPDVAPQIVCLEQADIWAPAEEDVEGADGGGDGLDGAGDLFSAAANPCRPWRNAGG